LLLAGRAALELDNVYQARYLLRQGLSSLPSQSQSRSPRAELATLLAALLLEQRDHCGALENTEVALAARIRSGGAGDPQSSALHLQAAQLALRDLPPGGCGDATAGALGLGVLPPRARAIWHFDHVKTASLDEAAHTELRDLARVLMWTYLDAPTLGLVDGSVSALQTDRDDLWIGTWNGGIARYTPPSQRVLPFDAGTASAAPVSVRSIAATRRHVYVGTLRGLTVYSKATGRWRPESPFAGGEEAERVSAVLGVGESVYVGTLGRGLWRRDADDGWQRVVAGPLPGPHINSLRALGGELWIGTLDLGVVILNVASGALKSFDQINPLLGPQNVTDIVLGRQQDVWITTFGNGLFRWQRGSNRVTHHTAAGGDIPDDWVLAGAQTATGMYFGTFGGGVVRYDYLHGSWSTIGLAQGLPSMDVAVVAYAAGSIYFGTLGAGVAALSEDRGRSILGAGLR
jgi:hypothetical protein